MIKTLTYYKPTIAFFVGRCANPKVSAKKLLLCEPEHLCLETHKKSNGGYNFSLCAILEKLKNALTLQQKNDYELLDRVEY